MIETFDYGILEVFQQIHSSVLTVFFQIFTMLGEGGAVWIVAGIILLVRKEQRKYGVIVIMSLLLCLVFGNGILKHVVARPRPCWRHPEVEMLISIPTDFSFPSGHTFSSFAAAVSITYWNKRCGCAAFGLAAIIAASRMYFYVHYPTDIIAGAVLGSMLALISIVIIEKWMMLNHKRNLSLREEE